MKVFRAIVLEVVPRKSKHKTCNMLTATGENIQVRLQRREGYMPRVGDVLQLVDLVTADNIVQNYTLIDSNNNRNEYA